jgi:rubrerythrin
MTPIEQRIEAILARIRATPDRDMNFDCRHCGWTFSRVSVEQLACPGCDRPVCRRCHDRRIHYARQTCRSLLTTKHVRA